MSGGERVSHEADERRTSPVNQPSRSPDKPANPEWLNEQMNDERFNDFYTPLVKEYIVVLSIMHCNSSQIVKLLIHRKVSKHFKSNTYFYRKFVVQDDLFINVILYRCFG